MQPKAAFVRKFLARLDRLDKAAVQNYVLQLADENQHYRFLLDELEEGVILVNAVGDLRLINRQAAMWLGLNSSEPPKGSFFELISDAPLAFFFKKNLTAVSYRITEDFLLLSPREMAVRVIMIPLNSMKDPETLILLQNRTEEKQREITADRLSRIEAMVRLAAGLAHEIGNPLNSLAIHLQLLKREVKDLPESRRRIFTEHLEVLNSETARLDKIVRNFLKATRRPPLGFRNENLNEILAEAVRVLKPEFEKQRMTLIFKEDPAIPPFLMDRERLHQVFINLIKNAMEAMGPGGSLKIRMAYQEPVAVIKFLDSGRGISEKDLPHIFEAYYTTKEEGSGLGLLTVYNAVAEHGGRIEVTSKPSKGTTFTIFLPIRRTKLQLPHSLKTQANLDR